MATKIEIKKTELTPYELEQAIERFFSLNEARPSTIEIFKGLEMDGIMCSGKELGISISNLIRKGILVVDFSGQHYDDTKVLFCKAVKCPNEDDTSSAQEGGL